MKRSEKVGKNRIAPGADASVAAKPKSGRSAPDISKLKIPPILLEGDDPSPAPATGPGERYALGPTTPTESFAIAELPEAYGTRRLLLAARDPHWLYAHWDFTSQQQRQLNKLSRQGHMILRIHAETISAKPAAEVHVHPESRNWFVHVGRGGARYVAELGYHRHDGEWVSVASSNAAFTPPAHMAASGPVEFATIPVDVPFQELAKIVETQVARNAPLARALGPARETSHGAQPQQAAFATAPWTSEQERATLAASVASDPNRVSFGSIEISEMLRRMLDEEHASMAAAGITSFEGITSPAGGLGSVSSPFGGEQPPRQFWFKVNAELTIYGATEPDASVTIGGRPIKLRPDGSFSYRFSLPDGQYQLPVEAVSADGADGRAAELRFERQTDYRGQVGAHPQDPTLKPPLPENV